MRPTFVLLRTLASVLFLTVTAMDGSGAAQSSPSADAAAAPAPASIVVSGCLEPAAGGRGFVLRTQPIAAGPGTPGTGTSATGTAPSGQVTGQTPTGATATETAAPTPAVGTPPATASPASPTYNQPASATANPSVSTADTPSQTGVAVYRLSALDGVNLREHAGHTVEVSGTLAGTTSGTESCCSGLQGPSARSHEPAAKQPNAGATGTSGRAPGAPAADGTTAVTPTLAVASIRHVAPTCRP